MSNYRFVVFGGGGVGKTALTIQFIAQHFAEAYDPTIEDIYRKQVAVDGLMQFLEILDTAGQDEYRVMRDQYIQDGDGFLLLYSITSRHSFEEIVEYRNQIVRLTDKPNTPMVLVGTKSDLEEMRQVTKTEGQTLADQWKVPFLEASAKYAFNINGSFFQLVRECRSREPSFNDKKKIKKPKCSIL